MDADRQQRLLVIGKNGQLARSIAKVAEEFAGLNITFSERCTLDLSSPHSIDDFFTHHRYDAIINTAAYTAVDQAESEPELADQINHLAVKRLAEIAKQQKSVLIHISTDYVFDGEANTPYQEEAPPHPTGVYGNTKLKGEQAMQEISPMGCIVRTSWLYSEFGHNFVKTMVRLGQERDALNVVVDQVGSPTYAVDLARAVLVIAQRGTLASSAEPQLYHYANDGLCSWYDFATAIFELKKMECELTPITSEQYPTAAKRPHYSVLTTQKLQQDYGLTTTYWRDALTECLQEIE